MPSASAYDLIVLDFDGTLADTRPAAAATFQAMFPGSTSGPPLVSILNAACSGIPLRATLRSLATELGIVLGEDRVEALALDYRRLYPDFSLQHSRPFPNAEDVVRRLSAAGYSLAIASNKGETAIGSFLLEHCLGDCFAVVLGDVPGRPCKPDRTLMFDHLFPHIPGAGADRTLVVGDTETDLVFARNCGASSCWASFGYGDREACAALDPTITVGSLADLADLLLGPAGAGS
jgi:phosphoglycolate phosphatase